MSSQVLEHPANLHPRDVWSWHLQYMKHLGVIKREKHAIVVVGSGLAGCMAAIRLAELGYNVKLIMSETKARAAHSGAAQGGINAPLNLAADGDSSDRFVRDTITGSDFMAPMETVYRMAYNAIDLAELMNSASVPFARGEQGQILVRSFGGAHNIMRTIYAGTLTGKVHLDAAHFQLREYERVGKITTYPMHTLMELVMHKGRARGIVVRNRYSGELSVISGSAVVFATGGFATIWGRSTNARNSSGAAIMLAYSHGALIADPSMVQFHPTVVPLDGFKQLLMSEALRNSIRVYSPIDATGIGIDTIVPMENRDYFLERMFPDSGGLPARDVASRAIWQIIQEGRGIGPGKRGVFLDVPGAVEQYGREKIERLYGPTLELYAQQMEIDPYTHPVLIGFAPHFTMGGLDVDLYLQTAVPGLFAIGEVNNDLHGANRLGANGLLGVASDGLMVSHGIDHYLSQASLDALSQKIMERSVKKVAELLIKTLKYDGSVSVGELRRKLGTLLWESAGVERSGMGLALALDNLDRLEEKFVVKRAVGGSVNGYNDALTQAYDLRLHLELAKLVLKDAEKRKESRGAHFRSDFPDRDPAQQGKQLWYRGKHGSDKTTFLPMDYGNHIEVEQRRY